MLDRLKQYCLINPLTIIILLLLYFFYFFIVDALEIVLPLYFQKIDIPAAVMGIIFSVANFLRFSSSILMIFKNLNYKTIVIFIFILLSISTLIFALSKNITFLFIMAVLVFSTRSLFNINLNPVLLYSVHSNNRGKLFGIRDVFLYGGSALGLFFCGIIVKKSFLWVFLLLSIISILALCIVIFLKKNELVQKEDTVQDRKFNFKKIKNKTTISFCVLGFLGSFISGSFFLIPYLGNEIGVSYENIFYAYTGSTVIAAIFSYFGGVITDKFSRKKLMILSMILNLLLYSFLFAANSIILFVICLLLISLQYIFSSVFPVFFSDFFNEEEGQVAWKMLVPFMLAAEMIAPTIWGVIWDSSMREYTFLISVLLVLVELIFFIIIFKTKIPHENAGEK